MSWRATCGLLILATACSRAPDRLTTSPAPASVEQVRTVERDLGYEATPNFRHSAAGEGFELCYSTGRTELPRDYSGLHLRRTDEAACRRLGERRDVFFYAPEALAGVETPVTPALERSESARRDFVVAHEDFHEQPGVRELPPDYKEAVSTLVGLVAARETARRRGDAPLHDEVALYLAKAKLINRYHRRLETLYEQGIDRRSKMRRKGRWFAELQRMCRALEPKPQAFDACPGAFNNAGLAFDFTYTRRFPEVYRLYAATGEVAGLTERVRKAMETD